MVFLFRLFVYYKGVYQLLVCQVEIYRFPIDIPVSAVAFFPWVTLIDQLKHLYQVDLELDFQLLLVYFRPCIVRLVRFIFLDRIGWFEFDCLINRLNPAPFKCFNFGSSKLPLITNGALISSGSNSRSFSSPQFVSRTVFPSFFNFAKIL